MAICCFHWNPKLTFITLNKQILLLQPGLNITAYIIHCELFQHHTPIPSYIIYNSSIIQLHPYNLKNMQATCQPLSLSLSFLPLFFLSLLLFLFPSFCFTFSFFPSFSPFFSFLFSFSLFPFFVGWGRGAEIVYNTEMYSKLQTHNISVLPLIWCEPILIFHQEL